MTVSVDYQELSNQKVFDFTRRSNGRPVRKIPQKSHETAFALANYRHMNQGKGTLKPVGHNLGTLEEGSERGISVTIRSHLETKKPTFVG